MTPEEIAAEIDEQAFDMEIRRHCETRLKELIAQAIQRERQRLAEAEKREDKAMVVFKEMYATNVGEYYPDHPTVLAAAAVTEEYKKSRKKGTTT